MIHFSKNTLRNAQLVYRLKDEIKNVLPHCQYDEADLLNVAEELISVLREEDVVDHHKDPGMRRDYRNYDVDNAFAAHQDEIFKTEYKGFDSFNDASFQVNQLMDRIDPTWMV